MIGFDEVTDATVAAGTHIATAGIVLAIGYVLARLARRFVRHVLERPQVARSLGPSMLQLLSSSVYYFLIALTVGLALIALGASATFVSSAAIILIAIVAIALRESIANFAATVNFLMFQPFRRGEVVETMDLRGTVQEILLFSTVILLEDQRLATLPNSKIQESGIINYSRMGRVRVDISLTVAYGEDLSRVRAVIASVARHDPRILSDPPFEVAIDSLTEDGVRLMVYPVVAPEHYWSVRSDLGEQIKARFEAEGIKFAVPRHDVRLGPVRDELIHPG